MKKFILLFICFLKFFFPIYSSDLNSLKNYLGKDYSMIEKDFPNIMIINQTYIYIYNDDENEYRIYFHVKNNIIFGITCSVLTNQQSVAENYFLKWKKEYSITSEGRLISDTLNEYSWIQYNNTFFIQIFLQNINKKYRVELYMLKI